MLSLPLLFGLMSLSCLLSGLAVLYSLHARKLLRAASTRSLMQLSSEVAELTSAFESMSASHRRLAARVGMREVRHRREEQLEQQPTAEAAPAIGEKFMTKEALREQARARGFKVP